MKKQQTQQRRSNSNSPRTSPSHQDRRNHSIPTQPSISHFASSAFLNSPDPSKIPVPDFDDDMDMNSRLFGDYVPPSALKTDTLKQFLNIRSPMLTVSS